ncbi:MAG: circularly permuted type 2 ATP-grasp protein [Blastocatellia bacterium]|nr:circularly permuted type 2 ATP-grasp protein [Blastocatellia bacterium]
MADDAVERLREGTERHRLTFGSRPICNVLRPMFISAEKYDYIRRDSSHVLRAIEKLSRALLADARMPRILDLSPEEEQIIRIDPGYSSPDGSGRLDAFFDATGEFRFVEYNADSPGGLLFGDVLSELFLEMEVMREFTRRFPVRRIDVRARILGMLLTSYREWGGRERPGIAIVDWNEVNTRTEFEISRAYFESRGYPTIIVDPDELDYRGGWLRARDFRVDLIYKRVVTGELLARGGLNHPIVRATRERAVCTVNAFRVQMLFKKAIFALLDEPANEALFSADEVAALRRHIPWTRSLREGHTTYHSRKVDLLEFVLANRDRLVLKPNSDYGGRGVVLGWECDDAKWRQAVLDALGASFVVQERVDVLQQPFPTLLDDRISFENRYVDFDPYTWNGDDVEGAGVRLSSSALLNVTAGGGSATPMYVLEEE